MFCVKCGAVMADNAQFCEECGTPVEGAQAQPAQPQQTYAQPQQAYAQPQYAQPAGVQQGFANVMRTPVKTNYSLLVYIVLSIVTCGIYGFYFVYSLAKDVNQICQEDGDNVGGLAAYILLSIVTCGLYSYYWMYKIQNRLQMAGPRYGVMISESGTTVLLWSILGYLLCGIGPYVAMYIVMNSTNKVGTAYNARHFYNHG